MQPGAVHATISGLDAKGVFTINGNHHRFQ